MTLLIKSLGIFNKTEIPELRNSGMLLLLNKDKIFELRNSEILFSLKISSFGKLMKN